MGNDGSAYVTGSFTGTITFPTATGRITLTSAGDNDAVVFKLDTAGNVLWAQRAGSAQRDSGGAVAVADDGSVYVAGGFNGTADFGADTLSKSGNTGFLTKMSTETGEFIWARTTPAGGVETSSSGRGATFSLSAGRGATSSLSAATWHVSMLVEICSGTFRG